MHSAYTYTINAVSFYYLWNGAIYKRQYTDKTLTLRTCMCMRASVASELRKFWHFYILKLLFLSIFCRYIRYFVGTNDMLVGLYMYRQISKCTDKSPKRHYGGGGGAIAPLPPSGYANAPPPPKKKKKKTKKKNTHTHTHTHTQTNIPIRHLAAKNVAYEGAGEEA